MVDQKAASKYPDILRGSNGLLVFCLACVFGVGAYHFLSWPISGGADTDLWYHLNGGRYFFENHKPADSGFFSFIANDRTWANYYWLFQATVYGIFSVFDYQGLVVFRALFYLLTLAAIVCFLLRGIKREDLYIYFTVLAVIFFLALIPRYFSTLRPHIFSYFFIVLFLLILESKNKYGLISLPLLAIFWCNVHGVEYPVLMLICFAYLGETLVVRITSRIPLSRQTVLGLLPILIAVYGVFATPFGSRLLFSPFLSAPHQHLYIGELGRGGLAGLLSINLSTVIATFSSLSNLLLVVALISFLKGLLTKKMKISHLVLFVGSVLLLFKAHRFRYEFVLLCLPVMKAYPLMQMNIKEGHLSKIGRIATAAVTLFISLFFLQKVFNPKPHYPMSKFDIPAGIAAYLNQIDTGGKILNFPGHGGYLQWELGKKYPIFMDLEMMLFTDKDIFKATNAFKDKNVLAKVILEHQPEFITPLLGNKRFKETVRGFPQYKPIFFDDTAVLYIDTNKHPRIAAENNLGRLDPFALQQMDIAELGDQEADAMAKQLEQVYAIFPEGFLINQMLVQIYRRKSQLDKALHHTEQLIRNFPEHYTGYQLKGDILTAKNNCAAALVSYNRVLSVSGDKSQPALHRKLSGCYLNEGQPQMAYRSLKKAVNLFAPGTSYRDYYDLGKLALAAGETKDAVMFLEFALMKMPAEEKKLRTEVQRRLMRVMLNDS